MNIFKLASAGLALLALAGCQTVSSNATAFHSITPGTVETFTVRAASGHSGSLEANSYAELIGRRLGESGWTSAARGDVIVTFGYGIDGGRTEVSSVPIYGQTGGGTTYTSGSVYSSGGFGSYTGTSYTPTTYGVVGAAPVTQTVYTRTFKVDMHSRQSGQKIYEGTVISTGTNESVSAVAACMIDALFKEFPGPSGQQRTVRVTTSECGG